MNIEDIPTEWRNAAIEASRNCYGASVGTVADQILAAVVPLIYKSLSMPDEYWLDDDPELCASSLEDFLLNGDVDEEHVYKINCARNLLSIYVIYPKDDLAEPLVFKTRKEAEAYCAKKP